MFNPCATAALFHLGGCCGKTRARSYSQSLCSQLLLLNNQYNSCVLTVLISLETFNNYLMIIHTSFMEKCPWTSEEKRKHLSFLQNVAGHTKLLNVWLYKNLVCDKRICSVRLPGNELNRHRPFDISSLIHLLVDQWAKY